MHCACTKRPYFHFRSDVTVVFLDADFPCENFGDSRTFKADDYLIFTWVFRTFWSKMEIFWRRQNMGRGGAILTPNELVLPFGVLTSVPIFVKIDQEMRPWECSQTDTQTDWQTQTDFIICPMLYAIAMVQIIMIIIIFGIVRWYSNVWTSLRRGHLRQQGNRPCFWYRSGTRWPPPLPGLGVSYRHVFLTETSV